MFSDFILVEPFLFQIDLVVIISTRRPELALLNTFSPLMQNVYIHVRAFPLKNHKGSNSKPWFWILILKFVRFFLSYRFDRRLSLWKNELFSLYIYMCVCLLKSAIKINMNFISKPILYEYMWSRKLEQSSWWFYMFLNKLHFNSSPVSKLWQFHT